MRRLFPFLALVTAMPVDAAPIAPTAQWQVDFDDAQCVASRQYGEDILFLKSSPMGDVVQIGLMRPAGYSSARQIDAEFRPEGGAAFKGNAIAWSPSKSSRRIYMVNMPVAEFNRLSSSPTLQLRLGDLERHLAVSGMPQLTKVMKSCVDDLQSIWLDDKEKGPKAKANLASYIKDDDYPPDAIRWEQAGTTSFALLVDETGKVADCMVTQSSNQAILDTQSCALLMARARFTPATGKDGKPGKGRVTGRIRWVIPD